MAEGLVSAVVHAAQVEPASAVLAHYDLALWAAGYEARSAWLVRSKYRPIDVGQWWKAEFADHRQALSGYSSRSIDLGALLGGRPIRQNHDGEWVAVWNEVVDDAYAKVNRPLHIFIDYSSMPRALYGSVVVEAVRHQTDKVASLTLAYVPGQHGPDVDGSRSITGLRTLIGVDGKSQYERMAFVFGLGYDGTLAQAILEMFQITHFSCWYASPGVSDISVERCVEANRAVISRADRVGATPAWDVGATVDEILRLSSWYAEYRDVLVVPLGPKPHVIAAVLAAALRPALGFRFPQTNRLRPVEVKVHDEAVPYFTRVYVKPRAFEPNAARTSVNEDSV